MAIFKKNPLRHADIPVYRPGKVIPVVSARKLMDARGPEALMFEVKKRAALDDAGFDMLYTDFVRSFADFVQVIPAKPNATLGGLLNQGLLRGINALNHLVQTYPDADALEHYAIFTTAVLYDTSATIINQRILSPVTTWKSCKGGNY